MPCGQVAVSGLAPKTRARVSHCKRAIAGGTGGDHRPGRLIKPGYAVFAAFPTCVFHRSWVRDRKPSLPRRPLARHHTRRFLPVNYPKLAVIGATEAGRSDHKSLPFHPLDGEIL